MGVRDAKARAEAVSRRGKQWVERQDADERERALLDAYDVREAASA